MKRLPLLLLLALNTITLAGPAIADEPVPTPPPAASDKAWSVTGLWFAMHTAWSGPITLTADGTMLNSQGRNDGGWTLTTQQGQVHLLIRWANWPTDDLLMLNANEFYGSKDNGRVELRLRRQRPAASPAAAEGSDHGVETASWHQGEAPVKLLRVDEGFCALTSVTGHFEGGGEAVRVYVAEDGYWYLAGRSSQNDVAGECVVIRYRSLTDK